MASAAPAPPIRNIPSIAASPEITTHTVAPTTTLPMSPRTLSRMSPWPSARARLSVVHVKIFRTAAKKPGSSATT